MTHAQPAVPFRLSCTAGVEPLFRIATRHLTMRLVDENDFSVLYRLRRSAEPEFLRSTDPDPRVQLEYIRTARLKAARGEEIYYAILGLPGLGEPIGFIRIADLKQPEYFSFHSLVVDRSAHPMVAIDAIFSVLTIGFEVLGFNRSDGLRVYGGHRRMLAIHRSMGILTEERSEGGYVYLYATRERYLARRDVFARLGFGQLSFGSV